MKRAIKRLSSWITLAVWTLERTNRDHWHSLAEEVIVLLFVLERRVQDSPSLYYLDFSHLEPVEHESSFRQSGPHFHRHKHFYNPTQQKAFTFNLKVKLGVTVGWWSYLDWVLRIFLPPRIVQVHYLHKNRLTLLLHNTEVLQYWVADFTH